MSQEHEIISTDIKSNTFKGKRDEMKNKGKRKMLKISL